MKALSTALSHNTTLTHLDLSHNRLKITDCELLGQSLRSNHTLLGIHVGGNDMKVDGYGFILPTAKMNDPYNAHLFTRMPPTSNSYQKERGHEWDKCSNCWICQKWNEAR